MKNYPIFVPHQTNLPTMPTHTFPAANFAQTFSNPEGKKLNGAPFTIRSKKTGKDMTFVVAQKPFRGHNYLHVSVETQYLEFNYVGYFRDGKILRKGGVEVDTPSAKVMAWVFRQIFAGGIAALEENVEIFHMGKCAKCGKALTDATSIEIGLGPICRSY